MSGGEKARLVEAARKVGQYATSQQIASAAGFTSRKVISRYFGSVQNFKREFAALQPMNYETRQIVLGGLLGDMGCARNENSRLSETHAISQKDYLVWKFSFLNEFRPKIVMLKRKPHIAAWTRVSPKLNEFYNLFYSGGRKSVSENVLSQLDPMGLAIWYCDDGSYDISHKTVCLCTQAFSKPEVELLQRWFSERWELQSVLKQAKDSEQFVLRFDVENSEKFLSVVRPEILKMPRCMYYKLGHLWEGNKEQILEALSRKRAQAKIYNSLERVKARNRANTKIYYQRHRTEILDRLKLPEAREKSRLRASIYRAKPEVRAKLRTYQKTYRSRPDIKLKHATYQQEYRMRPQTKARLKVYYRRYKAKEENM